MKPDRLLDLFCELARIESPSRREAPMAKRCKAELEDLGFTVRFDDSAERTGSDTGNLIAFRAGSVSGAVALCGHMDTVRPCKGIEPVVEGGVIRSAGDTILSADDKAGVAAIFEGVRSLIEDGAREVVLTGIDLGRYEFGNLDLAGLLVRILEETEVARLRLSSIEPAGVTDELLRVMANSEGRVAPFLHIPLQSGCDATLSRMGRPYTVAEYEEVVERARAALPGVAIACDLIVAFPGETDEEFSESLATCERIAFSKMHVFRYSRRPGTVAASMDGQVDPIVSAERGRLMRECAAVSRRSYVESLVGSEQLVLAEHDARGVTGGLVDVVVDEGHLGELISVVPSGLTSAGLLDARS